MDITIRLDRANRRVVIQSDGTPKELEVRQGAWSDWLRVKFKLGMLQSIRGMVRFHLVACEPELALYASPINFDPDTPMFPISAAPTPATSSMRSDCSTRPAWSKTTRG